MKNSIFTNKNERYISALLVLHGIRQSDLARKIGVSRPFVTLVLQGKRGGTRKPGTGVDKIRKTVSEALNIPVDELWPKKAA